MALSHDHKPMSVTEKRRIEGAGGFVNAVSPHNVTCSVWQRFRLQ